MLANRVELEKIPSVMQNKEFLIEPKFDGERCQLHKDGDNYKYFSRK